MAARWSREGRRHVRYPPKTLHKRAQSQPPRTGTCVPPFDVEFPNFESTAPSHHRRNLDRFCLINPGRPAGSADCSNHFDASIAGKTYVNLNDLGCERIVGAGRPRKIIFLSAAAGRSNRSGFRRM
jgi:hypothetical protein